jgi:hypothetical protein
MLIFCEILANGSSALSLASLHRLVKENPTDSRTDQPEYQRTAKKWQVVPANTNRCQMKWP